MHVRFGPAHLPVLELHWIDRPFAERPSKLDPAGEMHPMLPPGEATDFGVSLSTFMASASREALPEPEPSSSCGSEWFFENLLPLLGGRVGRSRVGTPRPPAAPDIENARD